MLLVLEGGFPVPPPVVKTYAADLLLARKEASRLTALASWQTTSNSPTPRQPSEPPNPNANADDSPRKCFLPFVPAI